MSINPKTNNHQVLFNIMCYIVIFVGVLLAIQQFILNRSLWLDEASLALNIINKRLFELGKAIRS